MSWIFFRDDGNRNSLGPSKSAPPPAANACLEDQHFLDYDCATKSPQRLRRTYSFIPAPGSVRIWRRFFLPFSITRLPLLTLSYGKLLSLRRLLHRKNVIKALLILALTLLALSVFIGLLAVLYGGIPPSYRNVRQKERALPQHHWKSLADVLLASEGKPRHFHLNPHDGHENLDDEGDGQTYLRFPDHLWGHGLNNVLQEILLYALLSHHSNRSFVFEDFVWSHLPFPYTLYDFTLRLTRVPLGAFLGGWVVGDGGGEDAECGVTEENFGGNGAISDLETHVFADEENGEREAEREGEAEEWRRGDGPRMSTGDHPGFRSRGKRTDVHFSPPPTSSSISAEAQSKVLPRRTTRNGEYVDSLDTHLHSRSGFSSLPSWRSTLTARSNPPWAFPRKAAPKDSWKETRTIPKRSISAEYFEYVCPPSQRVEIVYTWPSSPSSAKHGSDKSTSSTSSASVAQELVDIRGISPPAPSSGHESAGTSCALPSPPLYLPPPPATADGVEILRWWVDRLNRDDVRGKKCVVIREVERRVWDSDFFGSTRILSLFPLLRDSPVLGAFEWSSLVKGAVERSIATLFGRSSTTTKPPTKLAEPTNGESRSTATHGNSTDGINFVPGVLAVHLRRGDYKRHCLRLSRWGAGYMGWNRVVDGQGEGPDRLAFQAGLKAFLTAEKDDSEGNDFVPAEADADVGPGDEVRKEAYYLVHCLPTIPQIVHRLGKVRAEYEAALSASANASTSCYSSEKEKHGLTQVYILTNGWPSFVAELRLTLLAEGWERVVASVDLENGGMVDLEADIPRQEDNPANEYVGHASVQVTKWAGLTREEKGVSAAIDMGLAERAEVFVGNGFSSLSANIVMLRLAKGFPINSNRLL